MASPPAKKARLSYSVKFKLEAISFAENKGGNRKSANYFGIDESLVRDWRKKKDELQSLCEIKGSTTRNRERKRLVGAGKKPVLDENFIVERVRTSCHTSYCACKLMLH